MAKQLNVNLAFGADTSKAKAAIEDLNKTLTKIQNTPGRGGLIDDVSIRRASEAAKELQQHLSRAVNTDTGKLDLNRFSQSLKSSGKDLKSYYNDLSKIGPTGEQAFIKLSRSIATAETSTVRINKRMQEFATTMKNTARWQISSSILHGFMGAIQSAYGYAQDLNASLNDIRIVTGASAEQMEKFAEKANRAAKALSTTTTEYTKASLIYFQQGLSDSEVEARTNVTIKMANAAGQSAETISDQLTAVWNNFYDGTQSLEHFADAMVRLGADTASSSDEIAAGLEKFASIGPMIGLGFDEAAAALATVTAQTRQSADVVGTAYKTIFARMQGLNLGETLDDGTTLNKYSEALAKVGINIKDQNGAIKDMNDLILEMGEKWNTISKDQQIALAQAVGGVRQYNQIVALMDNFDFYEQNLASAKNSEGSLDMQAAIYAESWEAAQDRVKAAAEGVYDSLLNEDFFIGFNDGLSVLLGGVEGLVDGLGGMTGIIATIGSLMARHFAKEAPAALKNLKENIQGILGLQSKDSKKTVEDNTNILNNMDKTDPIKMSHNATIQSAQTLNKMTQQLNENQRLLSEEERKAYQAKIDQVEATYDLIIAEGKELEAAEKKTAELEKQAIKKAAAAKIQEDSEKEARDQIGERKEDETEKQYESRVAKRTSEIVDEKRKKTESVAGSRSKESKQSQQEKEIKKQTTALKNLIKESEKYERMQRNAKAQAKSWRDNADAIKQNEKEASALAGKMKQALKHMGDVDESTEEFKTLQQLLESGSTDVDALIDAFEKVANSDAVFDPVIKKLDELDENIADVETSLNGLGMDGADIDALEEDFREGAKAVQDFEEGLQNLEDTADEAPQYIVKTSEALASVGAAAGALVGMMSSIEGTMDVFSDEDASAIQKVGAAFGLLTTVVATATTVMEAAKKVEDAQILSKIKNTAVTGANSIATGVNALAQKGLAGAFQATIAPIKASGAALKAHPVMWIASIIMIAVGAITAIVTALDKAKEKRAEEAKVTKEAADAIYEEVQANNELFRSYEDALQAYKDGKGSKEDLVTATEALCAAYDIENAELLIAAGNYDALTAAIKKAEQAKLDQAKAKTQTAVADAEQVFEDQMRDGVGHFAGGDYIAKIGGGASSKDEKQVKNAINDLIASGDINGDIISHDGNDINLNTGQTTQDLIEAYEEMQKLQNYLAQNVDPEDLDKSENYQNLVDWLAKSSESYQNLIGLQEQLQDVSVQSAKNDVVKAHGEISTMEEYRQAEDDLTNALLADKSLNLDVDSARELAQQALAAEQSYAQMALDAQILDQATAATNGNVSSEEMEEFFNSLSDDEKTLFATLNFDSAQSIEDLENQLAVLQERANNTSIRTNLEAVENAQDKLKDDMSVDDYKDFETDSGIAWGEGDVVKYSEFLKMTYDEQIDYLESLNEKYSGALEQSSGDLIEANKNRIIEIKKQLPELEETVNEMEDILDSKGDGNLVTKAQKLDSSSATYQTDLNNLASEYGVSAEDIQSYLDAYDNAVALNNEINSLNSEISNLEDEAEINEILDFAQAKEDVQGLVKELKGLEAGDTIDADQYKVLSEYLPQLKKQFVETADGTYRLASGLDEVNLGWEDLKNLTHENGERLFSSEDIANSITDINELRDAYSNYAVNYSDYKTRLKDIVDTEMASATSLEELHNITQQALEFGAGVNYNTYAEALMRLGEQYSNCADEVEKYNKALLSGDDAQTKAAQSALELSIRTGELAEKYDLEAEALENYAERLQESVEGQELSAEAALNMAVASKRLDRGMGNVNKSFKDYKKILKDDNKLTSEYSETMDDLKSNLADIFNVADGDMFSDTFAKGLLDSETFEKALDGDIEALNSLRASAAVDIGDNIIADLGEAANTTQTEFRNAVGEIVNASYTAQSAWDYVRGVLSDGFTLSEINDAQFVESLNQMIQASGMTKDQITSMLGSMGVSAKVVTSYKEQETEVPTYYEYSVNEGWSDFSYTDGATGETVEEKRPKIRKMTVPGAPVKVKGYVPTYSLETSSGGTSSGGDIDYSSTFESASPPQVSSSSTTSGVNPGGGGGGSPKATKDERQKKSSVVKRYKPIDDKIDDLTDALNDASKAADRLYGQDRLTAMRKANDLLDDEITLLKQKKTEAEDTYYTEDQEELENAAADLGLTLNLDENGNITNYETALEQVWKTRESLLDTFGEEMDESQQKSLEELDKKIERLENAIEQFEETKELIEDLENEIEDAFYEWQDNNYEMLQLELELNLEVNENDLRMLELKLKQFEDNFYKMAEAAVLLGRDSVNNAKSQIGTYQSHKTDLDAAYAAGEISQADYMEGIKEVRDGIYSQIEALIDLDDQMMHYYRDTLAAAGEELANYTDHMEHLTGVFDHYLSLMEILGKQKDYNAMGDFLGGKAETVRDQLEVAQEYYEMLKENSKADEYWTNYQAALSVGDEDMAQWWKEQWDTETEALDEAQEKMLSLTEEWAEAMKAVIENNMNQIADALEKSLTDGLGFDRLMDNFEKLNTRQEEYLTKTNQIYETNKLMRTASKALDETDNKVSKQKLKNFIDETKSLQENTKLSQYELEIQQAKYDLLLAEIALEKAQNAKSTVRLSRDNKGNFGYVYTADEDKIADAEQAVEDKENALYNISLEGQKDYTEKYLQAQQEMYNSLAELQQMYLNGEIATEEEFKARQAEIINHYFGEDGVLTTYSHLYNIAVQTDTAATQDFWAAEYGEMTRNTAEWQSAVDGYLIQIQEKTTNWKQVSEQANKDVKGALGDSKKATKELTEESETLRKKIVNDVIPAISKEIQSVQQQTSAYASQRKELLNLIETYRQYLATLNTQVAKANVDFDKNTDYSAVINDYLVDGGKVGDKVYNQLLAQRDAKIEWLKTDAGGNKTKEYWKTSGQATTDMYNKIYGTDDAWLNGDYFTDKELKEKLHALGVAGYATGGYTGDWGPEGKLAVLHEKELVLNSEDTDNLLKTVDFIREIVHMIDTQASISSLFSMIATSGVLTNSETLEQTVTIHAEFPNATNHNEIEEAFNNLINTASQYANRK